MLIKANVDKKLAEDTAFIEFLIPRYLKAKVLFLYLFVGAGGSLFRYQKVEIQQVHLQPMFIIFKCHMDCIALYHYESSLHYNFESNMRIVGGKEFLRV